MSEKKVCQQCGDLLKDQEAKRCPDIHPCDLRALDRARTEIKTLKISVDKWKDSWFEYRNLVGQLWWHHPAITDDKQREYYQNVISKTNG
jgi:hypothetical protein